jgi:hypothetical protein
MSREGKIKRKVCVWQRKKRKKLIICVWENERGWKEEKERRGVARKIWEGWMKWKKNKSARKDVTLLRDETFTLFPTMCNPTTRTSSVPCSHIFFCPCTCPPF